MTDHLPFRFLTRVVASVAIAGIAHSAAGQAAVPAVPAVPAVRLSPITSSQPTASPQAVAPVQAQASARPSGTSAPRLSPTELADLKREYDSGSDEDRAALRAFYRDLGVDIEKVLSGDPSTTGQPAPTSLVQAVKVIDFNRTPQAVLAARSQLGFGTVAAPDPNDFTATASWLQLQVMAGEWETLAAFLAQAAPSDATAIYAHILQTINKPPRGNPNVKPDPALLPEEVLAIGDAAPGELSDWQVDVLAQLLKTAATKYSTDPMLALIADGTRMFGKADEIRRERTVRFLVAAGLVVPAAAYFPSIEDAKRKGDAAALLNHGRYHEEFASTRGGAEAEEHLRTAWQLYADVALLEGADAGFRQDAMRRAIDLLPTMPPAQTSPWLERVFASQSLAPAALEIIALKAVSLRDTKLDVAQRAQTILTMKESVDTLLAQTGLETESIKIPLRMLTTALVAEAESALDPAGNQNRGRPQAMPAEFELLLRALPDERWLGVLEPSLASRAYRAAIGIATRADEVDVAIDYLSHAVARFPRQGTEMADEFLRRWQERMSPQQSFDQDQMFFIGFVRNDISTAPLTRGRQRRNLERLSRLMGVLDGIGVDSRSLPSVSAIFTACHGRTEVFTREGIESVFGPVEALGAGTSAALAERMRAGLAGDWRDRRAQQAAGMRRSAAEITEMVERGYALAIELIDRSIQVDPRSWRYAVTKAGLTYERVQFKQAEDKQDFATYNQYRKEAFDAFAATASRYAERVVSGEQRDDPSVYLAWFNAAVGSTELNYLTREDLLVEGSPQDDQIDQIRRAFGELPPDAASRHIGGFARAISTSLGQLDPEVKPRIVRHAMRIIGDHPAGAGLRRLTDLYQDLIKDEIKLRLAVDGDDRVGADSRFGATLVLRFTAAVDRETGGFGRYLQNDVWARVGNTYRAMNYRDLLRRDIENAFGDRFEVESVGFFEAMAPPRPVTEGGEDGWLEKPLAYLLLKTKDPSVDRVPPVAMDMHFNDTVGPVTLPVMSNSPPIDAASTPPVRPLRKLEVIQTIDVRDLDNPDKSRAVLLEVHAKGEGVIPELDELLPGFRTALAGYDVGPKGVEVRALNVIESDADAQPRFVYNPQAEPPKPYLEPDENGAYRLTTERSWMVTYTPTGGAVGDRFTLPTLGAGLEGSMLVRQYDDMDIVNVAGASVPIHPSVWTPRNLLLGGLGAAALLAGGYFALRRRALGPESITAEGPSRISPLSVITALRRIRAERWGELDEDSRRSLIEEIATLERRYFGPGEAASPNGDLHAALRRWVAVART